MSDRSTPGRETMAAAPRPAPCRACLGGGAGQGPRGAAGSLCPEEPHGGAGLAMAVGLSGAVGFSGSRDGPVVSASSARDGRAAGGPRGGGAGGDHEAGDVSHVSALIRDAPSGKWLRHSHGARALGAQRREDDDDLYARPKPRRPRHPQPCRSSGRGFVSCAVRCTGKPRWVIAAYD